MNRPVFIIGCPRSGTTIFLELLAAHESFAWISNLLDHNSKKLFLSYYNRIYDIPLLRNYLFLKDRNKLMPHSVEPERFFNYYLSKFNLKRGGPIPPRNRTEHDITSKEIRDIRKVIQLVCKYQNKPIFLSKYTNFPRIKYFTQAFPDAKFIHLLRDGRAVANSYYTEIKEGRFATWDEREWWILGWPAAWRKNWIEKHNSPLGLVAYQWKYFVKEIWEESNYLSADQYLEVRYETLMESPKNTIRSVLNFCGLDFTPRIEAYIDHKALYNMNYKRRQKLDKEQQKELETIICEDEFKRSFEHGI